MAILRTVAGVIGMFIVGLSYLVAFAVLVFGTWWAIRAFIDGAVVEGLLILFFTAPATAIAQTVVSLVAIPLVAFAESGPHDYRTQYEPYDRLD